MMYGSILSSSEQLQGIKMFCESGEDADSMWFVVQNCSGQSRLVQGDGGGWQGVRRNHRGESNVIKRGGTATISVRSLG